MKEINAAEVSLDGARSNLTYLVQVANETRKGECVKGGKIHIVDGVEILEAFPRGVIRRQSPWSNAVEYSVGRYGC